MKRTSKDTEFKQLKNKNKFTSEIGVKIISTGREEILESS